MYQVEISHNSKTQWDIVSGNHFIAVDLKNEEGGEDEGPSPDELFLSALGSSAGISACRFLAKNELTSFSDIKIIVTGDKEVSPERISDIRLSVIFPSSFPQKMKSKLLKEIEKNSIATTMLMSSDYIIEEYNG